MWAGLAPAFIVGAGAGGAIAVSLHRVFQYDIHSTVDTPNPTKMNTMRLKTTVKAGLTPIYMSINDTGFSGRRSTRS